MVGLRNEHFIYGLDTLNLDLELNLDKVWWYYVVSLVQMILLSR